MNGINTATLNFFINFKLFGFPIQLYLISKLYYTTQMGLLILFILFNNRKICFFKGFVILKILWINKLIKLAMKIICSQDRVLHCFSGTAMVVYTVLLSPREINWDLKVTSNIYPSFRSSK